VGRWGRAGVVCAAAAKDCAAAGRVGEDWQVDWGLRLVDYRRICMTCGPVMSGDTRLSLCCLLGPLCKWLECVGLGLSQ
jgi:hypothetical protein